MSCADACLWMGDNPANAFHVARIRRARRPRACCECRRVIAPGERYEYVSAKNEGGLFTVHTCFPCVEVRTAFTCDGWLYGELWEAMRDQLFPAWRLHGTMIDCLAKLPSLEARDLCRAQYAEWANDVDEVAA